MTLTIFREFGGAKGTCSVKPEMRYSVAIYYTMFFANVIDFLFVNFCLGLAEGAV
jgi:hypothetical protein